LSSSNLVVNAPAVGFWGNVAVIGTSNFTLNSNGLDTSGLTFLGDLVIRNGNGLTAIPVGSGSTVGYDGQIMFGPEHGYHRVAGTWRRWRTETFPLAKLGVTGSRPILTASDIGFIYFDTTLAAQGRPIWWNGTLWVDDAGNPI
jgi:hypothetical protein